MTGQPAQVTDPFDDRMKAMILARAKSLTSPLLDDDGQEVQPAFDPEMALKTGFESLTKFIKSDDRRKRQVFDFLDGKSEELPDGWLRPASVSELRESQALTKMNVDREEDPLAWAWFDYVAGPASRYAAAKPQLATNMAVGAANLASDVVKTVSGVDLGKIDPIDLRKSLLASSRTFLTGESFAESLDHFDQRFENIEKTKSWQAKAVGDTAGFVGDVKAIFGGPGKAVMGPGMALGRGVAAKTAAKLGKEAPELVQKMAGTAVGFGALEGLTATSEDGKAPEWADRRAAAAWGAAMAVPMELLGEGGKRLFQSSIQKGLKNLGADEKTAIGAMRNWAEKYSVYPVSNEAPEAYMRRVINGYVDAGAPGMGIPYAQVKAHVRRAGAEGLGFSAMDEEFRTDLYRALWEGDADSAAKALQKFASTAVGIGILHVPLKDIPRWERNQPDPTGTKPKRIESEGRPQADVRPTSPQEPVKQLGEPQAPPKQLGAPQAGPVPWSDAIRLGWRPKQQANATETADLSEAKVEAKDVEGKTLPAGRESTVDFTIELPGTPFSYEVQGGFALPNQSLRKALGLPSARQLEKIPLEALQESVDRASLMAAMQSKVHVPGEEISAKGDKAEGGVIRAVRLGGLLVESDLKPGSKWRPSTEPFNRRAPDQIRDPNQLQAGEFLTAVLNNRSDLSQPNLEMLSSVIDVVRTVSGERDPSVQEAISVLPMLAQQMQSGPPEVAALAIDAFAEVLTIKSPQIAFGMDQAQQQAAPQGREGEAGFVSPQAVQEVASGIKEGASRVVRGAVDYVFRDQIPSIEMRSKDAGLAEEMRSVASRTRTIEGEAMAKFEAGEKAGRSELRGLMEMVSPGGVEKPRWEAVLQNEIEPRNENEAAFAKAQNDSLLSLWNASREAGTLLSRPSTKQQEGSRKGLREHDRSRPSSDSGVEYFRPSERDVALMPRVRGKDWPKVMGDPALRRGWFDLLAEKNPATVKDGGESRPRTGEDLEAEYLQSTGGKAESEVKGTEHDAALEHIRNLRNVPYLFNGNAMLEANPFEAMRRVIQKQASRVAAIERWGQSDIPKKTREEFGLDPAKLGVPDRIGRAARRLADADLNLSEKEKLDIVKDISDTMSRLQGVEPTSGRAWLDSTQNYINLVKASKIVTAGLWDVPSAFTESMKYGGIVRMAKAVRDVVANYGDRKIAARRAGSLVDRILHLDAESGIQLAGRLADIMSAPGNAMETLKTVIFDRVVDYFLDDMKAGRGGEFERQVLKGLGFKPQQVRRLMEGVAGPELRQMLRHHMVQAMTKRGQRAERSKFGASKLMTSLIWFGQWGAKNLYRMSMDLKDIAGYAKRGHTMRERAVAFQRLGYHAGGLMLLGGLGQLLSYIVADAFRMENGAARWLDEWMNYTKTSAVRASVGGALAGPFATLMQGATEDESELIRLVGPVDMVAKTIRIGHQAANGKGVLETLWDTAGTLGAVPMSGRIKTLASISNAYVLGDNTQRLKDMRAYWDWKRVEGIPFPSGFDKPKQYAFYDAMKRVRRKLNAMPFSESESDADRIMEETRVEIEAEVAEALELQPEESVAASVRAMRLLDENLTADQKDRLMTHLGEDWYARNISLDNMISDIAKGISGQSGKDPTEFETAVHMASRQALAGVRTAWDGVVSRAVEDAAESIKSNEPLGGDLSALADKMSIHYETIVAGSPLGQDVARWVMKQGMTQSQRKDRILHALTGKARKMANKRRTEALKSERGR